MIKKRWLQSLILQVIYKGFVQWFLKIFIGVNFGDNKFLKDKKQFIILANHNSHLDTMSLMASLPGELLWKVKPVAAEDYFGNTRLKAAFSNYFINTLLIKRKPGKEGGENPIRKMISALDAGYSLILFPEGTRALKDEMEAIKPGIAYILSMRPDIEYVPVFLTGMRKSLPKGETLILPYKSSVNFGEACTAKSTETEQIIEQITADFEVLTAKYQVVVEEDD